MALTIGLPASRVQVLDTLRRQRNVSDYTGEDIDSSTAEHCIAEAVRLLADVTRWLATERGDLIAPVK